MVNLVDDLLDVSKIEAGKLNLDYSKQDLAQLVQKNIAHNQALAAKKAICLNLEAESLPGALIDAAKIEQVLNNLIGNAIKFSPDGSKIYIILKRDSENFLLTVQDNGSGISEQAQKSLFKAFHVGQPGTQGEKSTGLGLAIVKRIVEGHGGKIRLESVESRGTSVFVSIPLLPPSDESEKK
jgi:signal transduction histidine kinase